MRLAKILAVALASTAVPSAEASDVTDGGPDEAKTGTVRAAGIILRSPPHVWTTLVDFASRPGSNREPKTSASCGWTVIACGWPSTCDSFWSTCATR
jgi:hypothetical protein